VAVEQEIRVPDIGDFEDVEVIEVLVAVGDSVKREDSLVTIESEKASMEIPSPFSGVIAEVAVSVGTRVSEGTLLARISTSDAETDAAQTARTREGAATEAGDALTAQRATAPRRADTQPPRADAIAAPPRAPAAAAPSPPTRTSHASPSVRRFARELGAELGRIQGSGPKGRIVRQDVQDRYNAGIQRRMPRMVWHTCKSWYLSKDGSNHALYPGLAAEYVARARRFHASDYEIAR